MQAVSTLASGVAHHFNNALQIVLGHAELIASTVEPGDPVGASAESEAALALAEKYRQSIQMVLTDLVMPGMNGYELAGRIERSRPGVKVLFMSAYDEAFTATYLKPGEAQLHLKKPFRIETLAWKVRRALSGI